MRLFNGKIGSLAFIAALLMLSASAKAEYVCEVTMLDNAQGSSYGDNGFVLVRFYTERNCGGSFMYQQWFCSTNANSTGCASNPKYHYSERGLMSLYEKLVDAAFWNREVRLNRVGCFGGYSQCAGNIYLTARY